METLVGNITTIVSTAMGWVTTAANTITAEGNEILLLAVLIPFVGVGIGLLKRLIGIRA